MASCESPELSLTPTATFALGTAAVGFLVLCTTKSAANAIDTLLLMVVLAALQAFVLGLPGEYWAHVFIGAVLCMAVPHALKPESGQGVNLGRSWWFGVVAAGLFAILIASEIVQTRIRTLHSFAHVVIETGALSLSCSAAIASTALERGSA